jgi:hypothetical protein
MKLILATLCCLLTGLAATAAEQVFVTYDSQGRPIYSDRPLSPQSKPLDIRTRPTDPEQVAAVEAELAAAEAQRRQRAADEQLVAGLSEDEAARRLEQCNRAREQAATYSTAQRLYEDLADGGRRYLTDEELERARESSRQAVIRHCTPR